MDELAWCVLTHPGECPLRHVSAFASRLRARADMNLPNRQAVTVEHQEDTVLNEPVHALANSRHPTITGHRTAESWPHCGMACDLTDHIGIGRTFNFALHERHDTQRNCNCRLLQDSTQRPSAIALRFKHKTTLRNRELTGQPIYALRLTSGRDDARSALRIREAIEGNAEIGVSISLPRRGHCQVITPASSFTSSTMEHISSERRRSRI